jgi:hypothetical protein
MAWMPPQGCHSFACHAPHGRVPHAGFGRGGHFDWAVQVIDRDPIRGWCRGVDRVHDGERTVNGRAADRGGRYFGFVEVDVFARRPGGARGPAASCFRDHIPHAIMDKMRRGGGRHLRAGYELFQRVIGVVVHQRADGGLAQAVALVVDVGLVARRAVIRQQVARVIPRVKPEGRLQSANAPWSRRAVTISRCGIGDDINQPIAYIT